MNYKELYKDLANLLQGSGCTVNDFDYLGYCRHTGIYEKAYIVINGKMTYKQKYMTLAHETGHLFYMSRNKERIIWSKKPRTEDQANQFVLLLLKMNDIDENEYKTFYSKALKASKKRKKCWFEP